jgi:uncharacterized protein (DUF433 family)
MDEPGDTLSDLALPDSLERIGGNIRVRGHRVALLLILDAYFAGLTEVEIHPRYPTIDPALLRAVLRFVAAHEPRMRDYCAAERSRVEMRMAARPDRAPSLEALRRRRAGKVHLRR